MQITSTELKSRLGKYLREAMRQPIEVTSHGDITHYLLSAEQYRQLQSAAKKKSPASQSRHSDAQD